MAEDGVTALGDRTVRCLFTARIRVLRTVPGSEREDEEGRLLGGSLKLVPRAGGPRISSARRARPAAQQHTCCWAPWGQRCLWVSEGNSLLSEGS